MYLVQSSVAKLKFRTSKKGEQEEINANPQNFITQSDVNYSAACVPVEHPLLEPVNIPHAVCEVRQHATLPTFGSDVIFAGHLSMCSPGTSCSALAEKPRPMYSRGETK